MKQDLLARLLDDLEAECASLEQVIHDAGSPWSRDSAAPGWTVADQVGHLIWTERATVASLTDARRFGVIEDLHSRSPGTYVDHTAKAESESPETLIERWRRSRGDLIAAVRDADPARKYPWFGPPLSPTMIATARIMEVWAHGQDVVDVVDVPRSATGRLRHVAHIGVLCRGFSFLNRGLDAPETSVRVELVAPDGELWTWGPADAAEKVSGPALDFCLLVTQRRHRDDLGVVADGPDAHAWLDVAQAFAGPPGRGRRPRAQV